MRRSRELPFLSQSFLPADSRSSLSTTAGPGNSDTRRCCGNDPRILTRDSPARTSNRSAATRPSTTFVYLAASFELYKFSRASEAESGLLNFSRLLRLRTSVGCSYLLSELWHTNLDRARVLQSMRSSRWARRQEWVPRARLDVEGRAPLRAGAGAARVRRKDQGRDNHGAIMCAESLWTPRCSQS
jgi:hypothetical protein